MSDVIVSRELDDTARLILMDKPDINAPTLRWVLRKEGIDTSLEEFLQLWTKYRGRLGRGGHTATHDVETGKPRLR